MRAEPIGEVTSLESARLARACPGAVVAFAGRTLYLVIAILAALVTVALVAYRRLRHRHDRGQTDIIVAERKRIARDLHDSLAQGLAGISYQLERLARQLGVDAAPALHDTVAQSLRMVGQMRLDARQIIWNLRARKGQLTTLRAALEDVARNLELLADPDVRVRIDGDERPLPESTTAEFLRIAQEATTNAIAHGQARQVDIIVSFESDAVALRVDNDGIGFDGVEKDDTPMHFGLLGMRERAERLGGTFTVESAPDQGTSVQVRIPTTRSHRAKTPPP